MINRIYRKVKAMNFKRFFPVALFAGMLTFGLGACDSKDDKEGGEPVVGPGAVDPTVDHPLSSTEAGDYLDQTAVEITKLFKTEDQKELVDVLDNFSENYAYYDFDEDDFNFEVGGNSMLNVMARSLAKGLSGDIASLSRASRAFVTNYQVSFDKLKGIYTPDSKTHTWHRDPNSNDIIFRFGTSEVKVQATGGNWDMAFDNSYEDYYGEEYEEHILVSVPRNVTLTITDSGKELVHGTVENNLDINGKTFFMKTGMRVANLTLDAKIEGNNTLISEAQSLYVSGTRLVSSTASLKGSNMCDMEHLAGLFDYDEISEAKADIDKTFRSGEAAVNILDRVQIKTEISNIGTLMELGDFDGDYPYNPNAESDAKKFANALDKYMKGQMYFGNTGAVQANIAWEIYKDEYYGYYTYWDVEPVMVFVADGSRFTFEEYFGDENRFADAANSIMSLINLYASLWQ